MAMARWDPFRDPMGLQSELNRLFSRTYGGESGGTTTGAWVPPLDIYESKEKFVVTVELPGIEPDSVDVSVEDSTLTIKGERSFTDEAIEASSDKGVLSIEIPKAEEAKPRKISIRATA